MYHEIVTDFRYRQKKHPEKHISNCIAQLNLSEGIEVAAKAIDKNGKINSHQRRVGRKKLENFASIIALQKSEISKAKSFDEVLDIIENVKSEYIGALTKYDTAVRIGARLGLYPDKIYLHAGTKVGARYLLGSAQVRGRKFIHLEDLPKEFLQFDLTASDFEDIFCNYKEAFRDGYFTPKY